MTRLIAFFVARPLLVNLIALFLILFGTYSAVTIPREAFPDVNLDMIEVGFVWPGASPEEIEQLVVTPIEQELKALNGIDKIQSVAFPGSGSIHLELDPDAANRDRLAGDVQLAVQRARLPADLPDAPYVVEIDGAVFSIINLVVSADRDALALKRLGHRMRDDLQQITGVARVTIPAAQREEIRITPDPARLARERLSIGEIAGQIRGWNLNAPGGEIDTPAGQRQVRIPGEFHDAQDAGNLVLRANDAGNTVRLRDVARVEAALEKPGVLRDVAGKPALTLVVLKKPGADIIEAVDAIRAWLPEVQKRYGADVQVSTYQDFSEYTRTRLGVLTGNGLQGLFLVTLTLFVFLRMSIAVSTSLSVPVILLTGVAVLHLAGLTLNLISMMGFIIAIGMLEDDSIVVGENIARYIEKGMAPAAAAVRGAAEVALPVVASVLTTILAFLPLMFMSGILGKFVIAIPLVVITLLVLSLAEAFLMLPSHVAKFTRGVHKERAWFLRLESRYVRLIHWTIAHYWKIVVISLAVLAGIVTLGVMKVPFQLFPPVGIDQFVIRATAPPGTRLEALRAQLLNLDRDVRERIPREYLETTVVISGEISVDEGDPLTQRGSRYGMVRVIYTPAVRRGAHDALVDMRGLQAFLAGRYSTLDLGFTEIRPGPIVGRALEVQLHGADPAATEAVARRLMRHLESIPGVTSVDSGIKPGDPEIHVVPDRARATWAGVDLDQVATHVRAAAGGWRVSTLRHGQEEVDVTLRYPDDSRGELARLRELRVPNASGGLVPLDRIARLEERTGVTTLRHEDGIRVVHVVADVDGEQLTSLALNRRVAASQAEWLGPEADRVGARYGGEQEKNEESFRGLVVSFVFAMIAVFFLLAATFNNIGLPFLVMTTVPFGVAGVILTFFLHDTFWRATPLSFLSTMGAIALSGVVVNNAIVLIDLVQRLRAEGHGVPHALAEGGRRRLRAVLLTSITTVLGLMPTAYGWGGGDPLVAPMALALGWGLAFSTVVTLVTLPAFFMAARDIRDRLMRRKSQGAALNPD